MEEFFSRFYSSFYFVVSFIIVRRGDFVFNVLFFCKFLEFCSYKLGVIVINKLIWIFMFCKVGFEFFDYSFRICVM